MATASRTHKVSPTVPMPRASRSFTVAYGLFQIGMGWAPLFKSDAGLKAHLTCPTHHGRLKQQYVCEHGGEVVALADADRTYEYAGQSVVLSDGVEEKIESERDGVIRLKSSVYADDIDPTWFEKSYLLWPTPGTQNEEAFVALLTAMRDTGMALVGQVVVSKSDRWLVIRWSKETGTLIAHICNYAANVKTTDVEKVASGEAAWATPSEEYVDMAKALLTNLHRDFDPNIVEDTYQQRLAEALYAQINGAAPVKEDEEEQLDAKVPDMLALLKASIDAANPVTTDA